MDFIRPIGPVDRDVDPVLRVERKRDEDHEAPERDQHRRPAKPRPNPPAPAAEAEPQTGPVEGDDGHLHIDIRA